MIKLCSCLYFDTEHVQIREVDDTFVMNLLPNAIITSPYEPFLDSEKEPPHCCLNSKPFSTSKLIADAKNLAKRFAISNLFRI